MKGLNEALANLNAEIAAIKQRSAKGAMAAGRVIEKGARELVPELSGELRDSSFTRRSSRDPNGAEVGFDAEYALKIHNDRDMRLKGKPRDGDRGVYWGPRGTSNFLKKSLEANAANAVQAFKNEL